jgi:hypothetical protein
MRTSPRDGQFWGDRAGVTENHPSNFEALHEFILDICKTWPVDPVERVVRSDEETLEKKSMGDVRICEMLWQISSEPPIMEIDPNLFS